MAGKKLWFIARLGIRIRLQNVLTKVWALFRVRNTDYVGEGPIFVFSTNGTFQLILYSIRVHSASVYHDCMQYYIITYKCYVCVCVCMYDVCMCVCVYVCMYVCTYVCMHVCKHE